MDTVTQALRIARAAGGPADTAGTLQQLRALDTGGVSMNTLANSFDRAIQHHLSLPEAQRVQNSKMAAQKFGRVAGFYKGTNKPINLLGKNKKLTKTEEGYEGGKPVELPDGRQIMAAGMSLAPAYQHGKFNTCPNSDSCKESCLGKTSGGNFAYGGGRDLEAYKGPRLIGLQKTLAMIHEPEAFAVRLHDEIEARKRIAAKEGKHLGVRLNVISDLHPKMTQSIIKAHPDVTFYDYTKLNSDPVAPNHHLTYSSTGVSQPKGLNNLEHAATNPHSNWRLMRNRLDTGSNVAMAFTHAKHLPEVVHDMESGKTYKVVDGDTHDFRPLDRQAKGDPGVIIGLRNKDNTRKGKDNFPTAAQSSHGFFVHYDPMLKNGKPTNKSVSIAPQPRRGAAPVSALGHNGGPSLEG